MRMNNFEARTLRSPVCGPAGLFGHGADNPDARSTFGTTERGLLAIGHTASNALVASLARRFSNFAARTFTYGNGNLDCDNGRFLIAEVRN